MSRINTYSLLIAVIALAQAPCRGEGPPDIVMVMTDDMGYSDLGCYGGEIETPHLDKLARDGVLCTNAYTPAPTCIIEVRPLANHMRSSFRKIH